MTIPDRLDEDRSLDVRTADMPNVVGIELTSKCAFGCVVCRTEAHQGDAHYMDFELYRSVLAELRRPSAIRLTYSGEPTLHPHILDAVELASATGAATELVSAFASFPGRQTERLVVSGLDRLTIWLHPL